MEYHPARQALLAFALCFLAACRPAAAPGGPPRDAAAGRIQADVATLAGDAMQGRETGTPGFDRAAAVVAARFRALGLQPAGDAGTYFQRVPLLKATRLAEGAQLEVIRAGRSVKLRFRDDFLPEPNFDALAGSVRAAAVFVGHGVSAPDLKHDDFAGLDLRGKIAVVLGGAPGSMDADRGAFEATVGEKLRALAARGAVGAVFIDTADDQLRAPWALRAENWDRPSLRLRGADGPGFDAVAQLKVVARVNAAAADVLFDGSGRSAAQLARAGRDGTPEGFAMPVTLALAARSYVLPTESRNVVGRLPGSDPVLAREAIVSSAHLDHLGRGAPVNGDATRNGALDNALGVAIVLETARQLQTAKPRRSLLFAALTGEEQGLLGAQWFAAHPPQPLVADINLDMPLLLAPTRDVVPIGAAHSTLQATLDDVAGAMQIGVSTDPFPEQAAFVRSDQFAFVRAGVPALYLDGGMVPGAASAGKRADERTLPKLAQRQFLRRCYHQPCDDIRQPIQYPDAARMARLNAALVLRLGKDPKAPRWTPGDFFGDRFGAPATSR